MVDRAVAGSSLGRLTILSLNGVLEAERAHRRSWREDGNYLEVFRSQVSQELGCAQHLYYFIAPCHGAKIGCTLALLNPHRKRMAEYMDIPTGKRLRLHRQAMRNFEMFVEE